MPYMHPVMKDNYGKWVFHSHPKPGVLYHRAESGAEAICGRFHRDAGQWISSLGDHDYWEAKTFHPTGNCLVKLEDITGRDSSVESGKRTYEAYLEILP